MLSFRTPAGSLLSVDATLEWRRPSSILANSRAARWTLPAALGLADRQLRRAGHAVMSARPAQPVRHFIETPPWL
jgi:hypothetical protein